MPPTFFLSYPLGVEKQMLGFTHLCCTMGRILSLGCGCLDKRSGVIRGFLSSALPVCLLCIAAVTAVLYWRRPDAFNNPQFWAEDGSEFFTDIFRLGARSLVLPMAGYFHIAARLVAWLGSFLPVRYAPHWYEFASWGLLVSIIVYIFSRRFSFGLGVKFLLAIALVATTVDNEVFFNLANWATLTSFFWMLLSISREPESKNQALFDVLILALAGLNTPFVICFWPLFLLRWLTRQTRHSLVLFLLCLAVTVIQIWNMPVRISAGSALPVWNKVYADVLIYRFGFMFLGEQIYQLSLSDPLRIYGLAIISVFYAGLLWQAIRDKNWDALSILGGGILAGALSLYVARQNPGAWLHTGGRHFYIPTVTLVWGLLLSDLRPKYIRWALLGALWVAFLFLTPNNKNQVLPDLHWAGRTAACIGAQPVCKIPINPVWDPPVWFATIR